MEAGESRFLDVRFFVVGDWMSLVYPEKHN